MITVVSPAFLVCCNFNPLGTIKDAGEPSEYPKVFVDGLHEDTCDPDSPLINISFILNS
jgi:hypothetical protein